MDMSPRIFTILFHPNAGNVQKPEGIRCVLLAILFHVFAALYASGVHAQASRSVEEDERGDKASKVRMIAHGNSAGRDYRRKRKRVNFDGLYLHRNRGRDWFEAQISITTDADGTVSFSTSADVFGGTELLIADANDMPLGYGRLIKFGWVENYIFTDGGIFADIELRKDSREDIFLTTSRGSLPDFNSRPDPYLAQHLLVRHFDFSKGGRQELKVYDRGQRRQGIREYRVVLELVDEDGVILPNGKFRAKHLAQVQITGSGTGFKKRRGHQTDYWVNDDLVILRIYRHREPYEVILQNYNKPEDLISADITAQGYQRPPKIRLTPLPPFDLRKIQGDLVFQGKYQHRGRGRNWFVGQISVVQRADGTTAYISEMEISEHMYMPDWEMESSVYMIIADKENLPVEFKSLSREDPNLSRTIKFLPGKLVETRKGGPPRDETVKYVVSEGALPDFNSWPDPYCTQQLLIRHYDLAKKGKQFFNLYDIDKEGKAMSEYKVSMSYVGDEHIQIPAGSFKARHILLEQMTDCDTWYKKQRGCKTDFWIDDDYRILRIFRHKGPYELILLAVVQ